MIDMEHDLFLPPKKTPTKTHIMITKKDIEERHERERERKGSTNISKLRGDIYYLKKSQCVLASNTSIHCGLRDKYSALRQDR